MINKYKANNCPYCGAKADIVIPDGEDIDCYWVNCNACFLQAPMFKKKVDAVRVWNSIKIEPFLKGGSGLVY